MSEPTARDEIRGILIEHFEGMGDRVEWAVDGLLRQFAMEVVAAYNPPSPEEVRDEPLPTRWTENDQRLYETDMTWLDGSVNDPSPISKEG